MHLALALFTFLGAAADPYLLPIGAPGDVELRPGTIVDTRTGAAVGPDDIAKAARGKRFVYLGESHATPAHHRLQAEIVEALLRDGRHVVVGVEMYTRPKQAFLDRWSRGELEEAEFLETSDWKGQWGFPFEAYRPVFEAARRHRLPMVALNVPRDWVRTVGREGLAGLPEEHRRELPAEIHLGNADHRKVFESLMGGHPMTGARAENIYAAQVVWDEGMADTALKWVSGLPPDPKTVFVVIAGAGHIMYGQGINYRVARRKGGEGVDVVMLPGGASRKVSRGLAHFVFLAPEADAGAKTAGPRRELAPAQHP
jgi:uncharacterized iron-regulated protein